VWNYLYALWRSVLGRGPEDASDDSSPGGPREELRRLLEERTRLQETAASYRDFGYDDLSARVREQVAAIDRRIGELRHRRRPAPARR
jgi:hypothetical protein